MLRWIGSALGSALNELKDKDDPTGQPSCSIYILECEKGKYYVGKSNTPDVRMAQHFDDAGAEWTRLYKPIRILQVYNGCDAFDEDKHTKRMMALHGIDNVRGGAYCQIVLDEAVRAVLEHEIASAGDQCYSCGSADHFVRVCPFVLSKGSQNSSQKVQHKQRKKEQWCARCGYDSHTQAACYAKVDINGFPISQGQHCFNCGRSSHMAAACYARRDLDGYLI